MTDGANVPTAGTAWRKDEKADAYCGLPGLHSRSSVHSPWGTEDGESGRGQPDSSPVPLMPLIWYSTGSSFTGCIAIRRVEAMSFQQQMDAVN